MGGFEYIAFQATLSDANNYHYYFYHMNYTLPEEAPNVVFLFLGAALLLRGLHLALYES
jgi:hypothetical protein